jgi:hypothetical protein
VSRDAAWLSEKYSTVICLPICHQLCRFSRLDWRKGTYNLRRVGPEADPLFRGEARPDAHAVSLVFDPDVAQRFVLVELAIDG